MKRIISTTDIFSMSMPKSREVIRVEGLSDVIEEHTAKLCMYGDSRQQDVNGWKRSICRAFSDISDITLKPKGRKFTSEEYFDMILSGYGDELKDKYVVLSYWRGKLTSLNSPYEDIDITDKMVDDCNNLFNLYIEFCEIISQSEDKVLYEDFRNKLDSTI